MDIDYLAMEGRGTKQEYQIWKTKIGTTDSPFGKFTNGLKLKEVIPHGPESEPEFPFQLVYEK